MVTDERLVVEPAVNEEADAALRWFAQERRSPGIRSAQELAARWIRGRGPGALAVGKAAWSWRVEGVWWWPKRGGRIRGCGWAKVWRATDLQTPFEMLRVVDVPRDRQTAPAAFVKKVCTRADFLRKSLAYHVTTCYKCYINCLISLMGEP